MKKRMCFLAIVFMLCLNGCNNTMKTDEEHILEESIIPDIEETENSSSRISYSGTSYNWQEITMIIPEEWNEKYIIEEFDTGFSILQKASYEKNENMGFLCSINRSKNYSADIPGATLIAYSDDGQFYYLTFPTDVTFFTEDKEISAEYMSMSEKLDWLAGSVTINKENVNFDANQYILVNSSISLIEDYQLMNLSDNQLWIARNEIYARHGRIFKNEYLNSYFNSCSWYKPIEGKTEVSDDELSQIEKDNLKLIIAAEQTFKEKHPYPKQYESNIEVSVPLTGDNEMHEIVYEASVDAEWNYTSFVKIDGTIYDLFDYVALADPVLDVFYITNILEDSDGLSDGLEIAILDNGPSDDPITHFFKYNGSLVYIGYVPGFPFKDYGNGIENKNQTVGLNGFTYQNGVMGTITTTFIETAYI